MRLLNSLLLFLFLSSCQNKIETYHTLHKSDLQRLKTLNLLNKDEKIVQFYSQYTRLLFCNIPYRRHFHIDQVNSDNRLFLRADLVSHFS